MGMFMRAFKRCDGQRLIDLIKYFEYFFLVQYLNSVDVSAAVRHQPLLKMTCRHEFVFLKLEKINML